MLKKNLKRAYSGVSGARLREPVPIFSEGDMLIAWAVSSKQKIGQNPNWRDFYLKNRDNLKARITLFLQQFHKERSNYL